MSWEKVLKIDTNTIDWNEYRHVADAVDIFLEIWEDNIDFDTKRQKEKLKEIVADAYNQVTQEDLDNPEFDMTELLHELSKDFKLKTKEGLR